ncbi:MAG: hypothetical protein GXX89_06865 [Clostridiales bacterium]|nr:hypothetical protein [Clostridiales bacterium]
MPDRVSPGPVCGTCDISEAVCIHTKKVYSSCRDKDCIEDLRVFLTRSSQAAVDAAVSVKNESAEILCVLIDVEPVPFNKGFFTVDITYFYRINADAHGATGRPCRITGVASFSKKVILFGSEGGVKIFSSASRQGGADEQQRARTNMPVACVETVDPVVLASHVIDNCDCCRRESPMVDLPDTVLCCFDEEIVIGNEGKRMFVTLGQFSIIKLERDSQLLVPSFGFCIPETDCSAGDPTSPCDVFETIKFPIDEFFPPTQTCPADRNAESASCNCKK